MMQLKGLKRAVKELVKGDYHTVEYKITEYHTGEIKHEWRVYTNQAGYSQTYNTPEEALNDLRQRHSRLGVD